MSNANEDKLDCLVNALEFAVECCIDLIDQYEEPRKKQGSKSSVTRNFAKRTLDLSRQFRSTNTKAETS